jgi:hypothetical protein
MSTRGEFELLTEILSEKDGGDMDGANKCPAPALLWALLERTPDSTSTTLPLREHVSHCASCAQLVERFRGFVEAADGNGQSADAEKAWSGAEARISRSIEKQLKAAMPQRRTSFWKMEWLRPARLNLAWVGGGCAMAMAVAVMAFYLNWDRQDTPASQLKAEASLWTQPAASPTSPDTGSATPDRVSSSKAASEGDTAVSTAAPAVTEMPAQFGARAEAAKGVATSAANAKDASSNASLLFASGKLAWVQIFLVKPEANGGHLVEGELRTLSDGGSASKNAVSFSVRVGKASAPVQLKIHSLEFEGKHFNVKGDTIGVSVNWPEGAGELVPGQTFSVRVINGTLVQGTTRSE